MTTRERGVGEALALGPALWERTRRDGRARIAASVVGERVVVLGAVQRAGAVVDLEACARGGAGVWRRATTGTAAWLEDGALVWSLALPSAAAIVRDATARTLLNRNVRGFLRGFTRAGATAHYFGREWIAVRHAPGALLGYDVGRDGAVLLEVLAGFGRSMALPGEVATERERGTDRWRGAAPCVLAEVVGAGVGAESFAARVLEVVAAWAGEDLVVEPEPAAVGEAPYAVRSEDDPWSVGSAWGAPVRVPIGWVEAARLRPGDGTEAFFVGGDVLAARWALADLAGARARGVPWTPGEELSLEGARVDDLLRALDAIRD